MLLSSVLAMLAFGATSAPAKANKHGADLIVTAASVETGPSPPYLVESPNGKAQAQHVDVAVTIRNVGDRAIPVSLGRLTLESDGHVLDDEVFKIAALDAKKSDHGSVGIFNPQVRLGKLRVVVTPNWNFHVPETHYANNRDVADIIPVIAKQWNVTVWSEHSLASFGLVDLDDTETAQPGFFFRFDHFAGSPDRFVYDATGTFVDNTHYDNPSCTGSGSGTASHSPWQDPSGLDMSYGLTRYNASLDMSSEDQFKFNITCNPGGQSTTSAKFFDPLTYPSGGGVPSMSPSDKKVSGSGSITRPGGTVTHIWLFKADVP